MEGILRNCDVGTPEEQGERFFRECLKYPCKTSPHSQRNFTLCILHWGQRPYEGSAETEEARA